MTGRTKKAVLSATAAMLLARPASASASVFCVDVVDVGCSPGTYNDEAGFVQALSDAAANAGPDDIRLGPEAYTAPSPNGFAYNQPDELSIFGSGQGATSVQVPPYGVNGQTVLGIELFSGTSPVTVTDLTISLPTPGGTGQTYRALVIGGEGHVENVNVGAPPGIENGLGVSIASGSVSNLSTDLSQLSSSQMNGLVATAGTSDDLVVENAGLVAASPIYYSNPGTGELIVRRSALAPGQSGAGIVVAAATGTIEDTLIDVSESGATGVYVGYENSAPHTSTATLDGVTIAGTAFNNKGVRVFTDDDSGSSGDVSTLTMRNSIIDPAIEDSVTRLTDTGGTANVFMHYSNYDPGDVFERNDRDLDMSTPGIGSISNGTGVTNLDPLFIGGGNFGLQPNSPLIDAGDPAAPASGALDYEGDPRAVLGKSGCGPRRDVGADEYVPVTAPTLLDCTAPDTGVTGRTKVKSKKKRARVSFTLTSTEAGSTFECSLDGAGFAPCASPFATTAKRGSHTLTVRAKDASGNLDATPASFTFRVVKKKVRRKR
jgi:hypothetical protein